MEVIIRGTPKEIAALFGWATADRARPLKLAIDAHALSLTRDRFLEALRKEGGKDAD